MAKSGYKCAINPSSLHPRRFWREACLCALFIDIQSAAAETSHQNASNTQETPPPLTTTKLDTERFYIELPPASIAESLNRLAQQTGVSIVFAFTPLQAISARPVIGWYTESQALEAMLKDTGFIAIRNETGIYRLERLIEEPAAMAEAPPVAAASPIEEVWVRGYRESLHSALAIKRHSPNISDSVNQEDIGKFPDNNIAEALQRLTGVAIERNGGEGQFITVRGFGPEFNRVFMNGRPLATDNQERGFSLDIIPADLIARAAVLKTQSATFNAGSIGAALNLHTPQFNDFRESDTQIRSRYQIATQLANISDSQSKNQQPSASRTLFLTAGGSESLPLFDIDAVAAIHLSERYRLREGFTTEGFRKADQVNIIDIDTGQSRFEREVFIPRSYRIYQTQDNRDQKSLTFNINISGDAHWQLPWQLSFDGFSSHYQTLAKTRGMQAYFEDTFSALTLDNTRTATAFTRLGTQSTQRLNSLANSDSTVSTQGVDAIAIEELRDTETYLLGSRFTIDLDHWQSAIDISQSEASLTSGGNPFSAQGFFSEQDASWQFNGDLNRAPDFSVSPFPTPTALKAHFLGRFDGDTHDRIQSLDWSNTIAHPWLGAEQWQGGIHVERRSKAYTHLEIPYPRNCAYCGRINSFNNETLSQLGLRADELFIPVQANHDFAGSIGGTFPRQWYDYDIDTLITVLESDAFIHQGPLDGEEISRRLQGLGFSAQTQPASYQVNERIRSAFIEASWGGEFSFLNALKIPETIKNITEAASWQLTLGSQYSHTTTTNYGTATPIADISRASDDDQLNITFGPAQAISTQASYEMWLPFANAAFRTGDHVIRAAYNHTITRPNLQDLGQQTQIVPRAGSANVFRGNVALKPYRTQNYDGAYEYYFRNNNFVGLNLFYKKMDRFISPAISQEMFGDYTLHINSVQNQERAHIYGAEIALIHHFSEGVGAQFNHTWVQSSAGFNEQKDFAIEGLSPRSLNFVGFIERPKYALRLSYNWRDDYLQERFNAQSQPQHSLAYGQWDFSSQWHLSDHAHISFDVQSPTTEHQH